jgi:regulatory protein
MKLIERVYRLLSIRDRSEKEIRDYVKRRNLKFKLKGRDLITDTEVEEVIESLKEKDLLNDERFAKAWTQSRSRKYGPIRIKQELAQKGIRNVEIETPNELEVANKLLQKKVKAWKGLELPELKKKSLEFLLRRGFDFGLAKEVVEKVLKKV